MASGPDASRRPPRARALTGTGTGPKGVRRSAIWAARWRRGARTHARPWSRPGVAVGPAFANGKVGRSGTAIPAELRLVEGDGEEATVDEPTSAEWVIGERVTLSALCS